MLIVKTSTKALIILGALCGGFMGAVAGWEWSITHGVRDIRMVVVYWSACCAVVFGFLTPLTSGRILQILSPLTIHGEFEKTSSAHWKFFIGFLFSLGVWCFVMAYGGMAIESFSAWQLYAAFTIPALLVVIVSFLFRRLPFTVAIILAACSLIIGVTRLFTRLNLF